MPKIKSHRGAKKRFRVTGTGKIMRSCAYKRHILTKKTTSRKRKLDQEVMVSKGDHLKVLKMIPYA